jgi:hypothetical protein
VFGQNAHDRTNAGNAPDEYVLPSSGYEAKILQEEGKRRRFRSVVKQREATAVLQLDGEHQQAGDGGGARE